MRLDATDLSWRAGSRQIVDGVSIAVEPGQTLGLIGPNGSGKSTLLRMLAGLVPRAVGEVRLDGQPLRSLSRRDVAQRIALVEQQADTAEALTLRDAVELGRTPWLTPLAPFGATDVAIVADALIATGLTPLQHQRWSTLSGGERQRAHIARALAQRPRLLLLDEPTNHLDIHHQLSLLRLISRLSVTVVVAIHDLNQAMDCDRLAVMSQGRLVASGPPREVLTPQRLADIFRVRASVLTDPVDMATRFRFHCLEGG